MIKRIYPVDYREDDEPKGPELSVRNPELIKMSWPEVRDEWGRMSGEHISVQRIARVGIGAVRKVKDLLMEDTELLKLYEDSIKEVIS